MSSSDIKVYPNPSYGKLSVSPTPEEVKVYTLDGDYVGGVDKVSSIPEGVYILKIIIDGEVYTKKLIRK